MRLRRTAAGLVAAAVSLGLAGCSDGPSNGPGAGAQASGDVGGVDTPGPSGAPAAPASAFRASVDRVVDGDTFVALVGGRRVRVRLVGVDAPETVKEGAPVGCYGPQASRYLKALLRPRSQVRGAYEAGGRTDRFGRDLWDVWLPDGRFVQGLLVGGGLARAREIRPQHEHAAWLARVQADARAARAGLWGVCAT